MATPATALTATPLLTTDEGRICGLWIDDEGKAHVALAPPKGGPRVQKAYSFRPFAWLGEGATEAAAPTGVEIQILGGEGVFRHLAHADNLDAFESLARRARDAGAVDVVRPLESQFLLQSRARLFRSVAFSDLRRLQLAIEWDPVEEEDTGAAPVSPALEYTSAGNGAAKRAAGKSPGTGAADGAKGGPASPLLTRAQSPAGAGGARGGMIRRISFLFGGQRTDLRRGEDTPAAEKKVLESFNGALAELDPDIIEGHGIFTGPLDHLRERFRRSKVPVLWGRFNQKATFRNSRLKAAERWIDFTRCDAPGRAFVDTQLLVQVYDVSAREMGGYGRAAAAEYFGVTSDDPLDEARALANLLLPTYFEQTRAFPLLLQDATLRGQTSKIDLLFLEEYYHARQSCPVPPEVAPFEGGFTKSYHEGVFHHVLHFDVASLYPSLLLTMGRNPRTDTLGVFIPMLKRLREYRLEFKQRARTAPTEDERAEAQARQTAFKILINSFYGYLGFSGARFGDGELAAEVTRRGRELLQNLIDEFGRVGATVLEADTDGIYVSSERYFSRPDVLLDLVDGVLPPGIELEFDGSYRAMVCYKAKNYALYDGEKLTLRGSAFRSRAMEPFLQRLTDRLLGFLVGAETEPPQPLWEDFRRRIATRELPARDLAKTEALSQSPESYERFVAEGGKPRRAVAEAALQMTPRPRMGERVSYYVGPKSKGQSTDWQRARPLAHFDAQSAPYDPAYYLEKLDDWKTRYGMFLPSEKTAPAEVQEELL